MMRKNKRAQELNYEGIPLFNNNALGVLPKPDLE